MAGGIVLSLLFGAVLWILSGTLSQGSAAVGKLWEAGASLIAVLFITYFIYWMLRHGSDIAGDVKKSVNLNLSARGLFLLAVVAVAREGAEIALFAFTAEAKGSYLTGTLSGVLIAAVLSYLIYSSLIRVNIRTVFRITLIYLILQGAYLFGYAIHEFLSALKTLELLSSDAAIFARVYNLGGTVLDHKTGVIGIAGNVLIGWYSKPEIIQAAAQMIYLLTFSVLWRKEQRR